MKRTAALLLVPCLVMVAGEGPSKRSSRRGGVVNSAKEAKTIAEQETGGVAVSAHRIPLNGASGGWEVDVRMPRDEKGWRCIIDADTRMVHRKDRIPNPGTARHSR